MKFERKKKRNQDYFQKEKSPSLLRKAVFCFKKKIRRRKKGLLEGRLRDPENRSIISRKY